MALIEWKEEFRIGIPSVDYEHQELIGLLNELYAGLAVESGGTFDRAVVGEFLGEVYARISAHFALEERVMREQNYVLYSQHKDNHEELLDSIRDIMDDAEVESTEPQADVLDPEDLGRRLDAWFSEHFRTHDARLHKALNPEGLDLGEI